MTAIVTRARGDGAHVDHSDDLTPQARPRRDRRRVLRADRVALALPAVLGALVTFRWFPLDRFLAAGDITPFVRNGTARELFDLWNHRSTGAGSTGSVAARLFEVGTVRVVGLFGGSEMLGQHLFYALLVAFAAFGVAYLTRAFVREPAVVAGAGVIGIFNPFLLTHLPNPLLPLWIGLVATAAGLVVRAARGTPVPGLKLAVASLPASFLSVNPPQLATATLTVLAVVLLASALTGVGGTRRALRLVGRALPWIIVLNLWWIVPTALATVSREGVVLSAQTRVQDWAWSHVQNSIPNVFTLTADWGWRHPEYSPWAHALDSRPWWLLRWIVPLLALAAPFSARGRRRRVALVLVAAGLVAALLGKGLHPPFVEVNLWLYEHVPGMWLLREPMSKVGSLLLLVEILLAAFTVAELLQRARNATRRLRRTIVAGVAGLVVLAAAFPFPLWLGQIGPDGHHGLPSARVAVPQSWRRLADTLNATRSNGKVLVLPLDRYYQVTTTWGFHGADELAQQLLRQPVLQLMPDGYYSPAGDTTALLHAAESALAAGDAAKTTVLLHALGVSTIVVRHDLARDQVLAPLVSPDALTRGIARITDVHGPRRFGVADVYDVRGDGVVSSPSTIAGVGRRSQDALVDAIATAGTDTAVVAPGAIPVDRLSWEADDGAASGVAFSLRHGGRYDVGLDTATPSDWFARVRTDASGPTVALSDPTTMTLDGERIPSAPPMTVAVDDPDVEALGIGTALVPMDHGTADVSITGPARVVAYAPSAPASNGTRFSAPGFCGPATQNAWARARADRASIALTASGGRACVTLPGSAVSPSGIYRVRFETRSPSGTAPEVCISQHGSGSCLATPALQASRAWRAQDVVVRSRPGTTGLTVFLYAHARGNGRASVEYRDVSVEPLRVAGRAEVSPEARPRQQRWLDAGSHDLRVERPRAGHPLALDSVLGDCAATDNRTPGEAGLAVQRIPAGVRLRAAAHAACVTAPLPSAQAGALYDVSLDVRTVAGRSARLCIWQDGPNRCAAVAPVPASGAWKHYETRVRLDPRTTAARVYVYADGQAHPSTVTEYRNLRVQPIRSELAHVTPVAAPPAAPSVTSRVSGASHVSANLDRGGPALVVLDESFGAGWKLTGARGARHVVANGYANAWYLPEGATHALSMTYAPSRLARLALVVSALGFLAAGLSVVGGVVRRRRSRRASARETAMLVEQDAPRRSPPPRASTIGILTACAACASLVRSTRRGPRRR